jgi:transposase
MRKGFDSLSGLVQQVMGCNALSGDVFIFISRNRRHVKLLLWEGDGLALYHKRLERGTFELPHPNDNALHGIISAEQLQWILQGIVLKSVRKRKRYQHSPV